MLMCVFVTVRAREGILRAASAGDLQLQGRAGGWDVLRGRPEAPGGGQVSGALQHVLPRLPQGVPEQRDEHGAVLVREHLEPGAGREFLHPGGS